MLNTAFPKPICEPDTARRSIALLVVAEIFAMGLWFLSSALLPEMGVEAALTVGHTATLSAAVQVGFVIGAILLAVLGTSDRYDPRIVFAFGAVIAAISSASMVLLPPGHTGQIALRWITGFALAGVYPVGMKIAVGWTTARRGTVVGLLIAALTLGAAIPHLFALAPGSGWRMPVLAAAAAASFSALLMAGVKLGPWHRTSTSLQAHALRLAYSDRRLRLAFAGYLGHMWELYAFWAWIATALTLSFTPDLGDVSATAARLVTITAIVAGASLCLVGGVLGDSHGNARIALLALWASATSALATALSFGGPPWLTAFFAIVWGAAIIPDSGQFSALVATYAPAESSGSLLTLQTALGFLLATLTVHALPHIAQLAGWTTALALLAAGPVCGTIAMHRLMKITAPAE